jgi:sec-independent protein translocase protein TatB
MFTIGWGEILMVLVIAFFVVGPQDLPRAARWLGRSVRKALNLYRTVMRTLELEDMAHETGEARGALEEAQKELSTALNEPVKAVQSLKNDMEVKL